MKNYSNIDQLCLSKKIQDMLINNNIFSINQLASIKISDLKQIYGINNNIAEKIKRTYYRYQWENKNKKEIKNIEQLKSIIKGFKNKDKIMLSKVNDLPFSMWAFWAFYNHNIITIGDLLNYNSSDILKFKCIGQSRYFDIIETLTEMVILMEEGVKELLKLPEADPLNTDLYSQPNLTFREILIKILTPRLSARDINIIFDRYLLANSKRNFYKKIALNYNLSSSRIGQICHKGLRILRCQRGVECITTYLNTVWKDKIHEFLKSNNYLVTRNQLEKKFSHELNEIYFFQNIILEIDDIWTLHLKKDIINHYFLK